MQAREVTQVPRGFKVFREFAEISVRKETRAVKALRVMPALRVRRGQKEMWVRQARREIWDTRVREVFPVQPAQPVRQALWVLRA